MYIKSNKSSKANHTFKKVSFFIFLFVCSVFTPTANAQCAMCRAALTSEGNATQAAAVNDGIVYLMVIPYILVAGIGYAIYRMKKNKS
ncbi:hypothetical protein [Flavobacterium petrolei]|jgi:hypothetical protein|uniref:hypothetical protein n=1 Tax=Flavobacterium petrolei TaxID=2259594 RepID=UPI001F5E1111|nr:hypothetical protein [Flavobacterium petrolei]